MFLFCCESLIRGCVRGDAKGISPAFAMAVDHGYARWLSTQELVSRRWDQQQIDGWLITERHL